MNNERIESALIYQYFMGNKYMMLPKILFKLGLYPLLGLSALQFYDKFWIY